MGAGYGHTQGARMRQEAALDTYHSPLTRAIDDVLDAADRGAAWATFRAERWPELVADAAADVGGSLTQLGRLELDKEWTARARSLKQELRAAAKGLRVVERDPFGEDGPAVLAWMGSLDMDEFGKPKRTAANLAVVLEHHPKFTGRARYNGFTGAIEYDGRGVRDEDYTDIQIALTNELGAEWTVDQIQRTMATAARRLAFDPVMDFFLGLPEWDGVERTPHWLADFLGVEDRPLAREYAKRFLVAVVARAMSPACQVDTVLVLQGRQGDGKSSAIRALAPCGFYTDTEADPGSKDFYQSLDGALLIELAEVEKWNNRRDSATIKSVITSRVDRYRPPYGRNVIERPRRCVFVGTTNEVELLNDPTGSRRWWPVKTGTTGPFRLDALKAAVPQLWAEAFKLYLAGEPWHLSPEWREEQEAEAAEWQVDDPWSGPVKEWLAGRAYEFTLLDVMQGIGIEVKDANTRDGKRVGALLRRFGCQPRKVRGHSARVWSRKVTP